jgi:hypothetical protein
MTPRPPAPVPAAPGGYAVPNIPGSGLRPPGLNAFEDEVLKRQALGLNPPPNSYERPMVPPTPAFPGAVRGGGSLDPHTLGSYKKLSDTFGTTRDRSGNVVASAAPPAVDEIRRGQLTPQNAPLSYTLGTTVDRFGNVIADPAAPRSFKDGGEAVSEDQTESSRMLDGMPAKKAVQRFSEGGSAAAVMSQQEYQAFLKGSPGVAEDQVRAILINMGMNPPPKVAPSPVQPATSAALQAQVNQWFADNPNATGQQVVDVIKNNGGLAANPGLADILATRYGVAPNEITNYYNTHAGAAPAPVQPAGRSSGLEAATPYTPYNPIVSTGGATPPAAPAGNIPITLAQGPAAFSLGTGRLSLGGTATPMAPMAPMAPATLSPSPSPAVALAPRSSGMNEFEKEVLRRSPAPAPANAPVETPAVFKDGGEVTGSASLDDYLQQQMGRDNDSSSALFDNAQKLFADFNEVPKVEPMRKIVKRVSRGSGGSSKTDKNMSIKVPPLAASKDMAFAPPSAQEAAETKSPSTAREQMEELVQMHQLKINAARNKARGLSANTFGAPTLEGATLTKGPLTKKRFAEGGEAKKSEDGEVSQEELDAASRPAFVSPNMRRATKISRANDPTDRIMGAIEPALTLGTGAVAAAVGMPRGIYKGLTSGKFKEGKAASIASKEAADFIERNTYVPRSESGKENLAALSKIAEDLKLAPAPGGAAMASLARPTAVRAQGANIADDFQEYNRQISVPGASYAVPPQGPTKTPAPASGLGFYSAAEQAALNLPRKEGSGAAFLNDLMKAPDVKKEELSAMGLDEFLRGKPKATRQEVQDFIANNRIDVKEVQLGEKVVEDPAGLAKRKEIFDKYEPEILALYKQMEAEPGGYSREREQRLMDKALEIQFRRDREADAAYTVPEPLPTKFGQFQLPGGKNYREILLTLPKQSPKVDPADVKVLATGTNKVGGKPFVSFEFKGERYVVEKTASETDQQAISRRIEAIPGVSDANTYRSSHFDEPNILAHMRVNDRVDADGKKMLLIEELQSDWHQAGREKGYKTGKERRSADVERELNAVTQKRSRLLEEAAALPDSEMAKFRVMNEEIKRLGEQATKLNNEWTTLLNKPDGVPDAPFKDTWHQLALKRALKYAADNGYERVGLTTGKQQSQRYNMGTQVDHISYEPTEKGFYINVISKDGPNVLNGDYSAKELEGIVGKELTQKMLAKEGKNEFNPEIEPDLAEVRRLDGVDLQLEDKGMKKYYDEIYPAFLAKQAKKYGAQVGETRIKTQTSAPAYVDYIVGRGNFTDTTVLGVRADGSTEIINQNPNSLQEAQQLANRYKEKHLGGGEPVRYIDIAPGMKGAVPYAKGGMVDKNTAFIKAHS